MTRFLIDSSVYIRAFRETSFGLELQDFHRRHLPRLVLSSVVASELLIGAQDTGHERRVRRALIEPFRTRRRLLVPAWSTWDLAAQIDRRLRAMAANRTKLAQRSFLHDLLIAASAREYGATIITENHADFALLASHVDIAFAPPWPHTAA